MKVLVWTTRLSCGAIKFYAVFINFWHTILSQQACYKREPRKLSIILAIQYWLVILASRQDRFTKLDMVNMLTLDIL